MDSPHRKRLGDRLLVFEKPEKSFGFTLEDRDGRCTVVSLDRGSSGEVVNEAERLGAREGDILLKVNHHSLLGVPFQEVITDRIKNAQYPITMHLQAASSHAELVVEQRQTLPKQGMQRQLQQLQMRHLMQQQQQQQQLLLTQQRQQQALQNHHSTINLHQHRQEAARQTTQLHHLNQHKSKRPHDAIGGSQINGRPQSMMRGALMPGAVARKSAAAPPKSSPVGPGAGAGTGGLCHHQGSGLSTASSSSNHSSITESIWESAVRAKASGFVSSQAKHVTNSKVQDDALTEIGARMVSRILRREKLRQDMNRETATPTRDQRQLPTEGRVLNASPSSGKAELLNGGPGSRTYGVQEGASMGGSTSAARSPKDFRAALSLTVGPPSDITNKSTTGVQEMKEGPKKEHEAPRVAITGSIHVELLEAKIRGLPDPFSSKAANDMRAAEADETESPLKELKQLGKRIRDDMHELKVEYNEICQRKEDLKTQYRDANTHHNDLSKACSDEAVFIKERHGRLKQRLQATDTTITQMRQKFNHLDAMVKANATAAAANGLGDGNVQIGCSIIGIDEKQASKLNGSGEAEQELQRYIAGINHTQTHRSNLDAERRKVEAQLELQGKQPEVFEARHKQRVGIMTSICEQFDYMLKVVHQHMVQLDKLRKAAVVDAERDAS